MCKRERYFYITGNLQNLIAKNISKFTDIYRFFSEANILGLLLRVRVRGGTLQIPPSAANPFVKGGKEICFIKGGNILFLVQAVSYQNDKYLLSL